MTQECSTLPLVRVSNVVRLSCAAVLVTTLFGGVITLAHAQENAPVPAASAVAKPAPAGDHVGKIAVVDVQYLVSNSAAGKSIRSQLEKQRNGYKGQIERQEADLRAQEKQLAEQQSTLSKEDFMAARKKFQEKVISAQKDVQQRRASFDKAYTGAMDKLREQIVKVVADLAGKQGASIVMSRQDLVLVDARLDMTEAVLKALDAKVTNIPVSIK